MKKCVSPTGGTGELLKSVQAKIARENQRLYDLRRATEILRMLEKDNQSAQYYFKIVERRAKQIAEAVEQDAGGKT